MSFAVLCCCVATCEYPPSLLLPLSIDGSTAFGRTFGGTNASNVQVFGQPRACERQALPCSLLGEGYRHSRSVREELTSEAESERMTIDSGWRRWSTSASGCPRRTLASDGGSTGQAQLQALLKDPRCEHRSHKAPTRALLIDTTVSSKPETVNEDPTILADWACELMAHVGASDDRFQGAPERPEQSAVPVLRATLEARGATLSTQLNCVLVMFPLINEGTRRQCMIECVPELTGRKVRLLREILLFQLDGDISCDDLSNGVEIFQTRSWTPRAHSSASLSHQRRCNLERREGTGTSAKLDHRRHQHPTRSRMWKDAVNDPRTWVDQLQQQRLQRNSVTRNTAPTQIGVLPHTVEDALMRFMFALPQAKDTSSQQHSVSLHVAS